MTTLALKGKGERPKDFLGKKKRNKILGMGPLYPKGMPKLPSKPSLIGSTTQLNYQESGSGAPISQPSQPSLPSQTSVSVQNEGGENQSQVESLAIETYPQESSSSSSEDVSSDPDEHILNQEK